MTDDLLLRLRKLLAPRYEVDVEIGRGGMGIVYAGRHVLLDQRVAIKVLRRGLESAVGIERFVRESRILGRLSHPNIVRVYDASDADSDLRFYIMEFLEGETLEARLERGPIGALDAAAIGRDILAGLQLAHERGIVHRDIKPSNIFLVHGRAVLTDFGVAKSLTEARVTAPDQTPGTIPYMAPEVLARAVAARRAGGDAPDAATPQSDLYSVAMVLYEATTGRSWDITAEPGELDDGLPVWFAVALRRALRRAPADRWPDAASFERALWAPRGPRIPVGWIAAGAAVAGVAVWIGVVGPCGVLGICREAQPLVRIEIREAGSPSPHSPLADSLACAVARDLDGYLDVRAGCPGEAGGARGHGTVVRGRVVRRGESLFVDLRGGDRVMAPVLAGGARGEWSRLVGVLSEELYARILEDSLDPLLPAAVLPKSKDGRRRFVEAERLVKDAQWVKAYEGFGAAILADSTCLMCFWRRAQFGRWLGHYPDAADVARYEAGADAFPEYYQRLIRAQALPISTRFDSLDALTRAWRDFLFGQFLAGDELLHRGPLRGRARRDARDGFDRAVGLHPQFAPGWEHLAILCIVEGDAVGASAALDGLRRTGAPGDPIGAGLRALLEMAYAWRFLDARDAARIMDETLERARAARAPVDVGSRLLLHFDTPRGALALAGRLDATPEAERSRRATEVVAYLMLGRPDSARAAARRLRDRFPEPRLGLFVEQLDAMIAILDGAASGPPWPDIEGALAPYADLHAASVQDRRRAAWTLALHAVRRGIPAARQPHRAPLGEEPSPRPLARFLQAADLARAGHYELALGVSDTLTAMLAPDLPDPFLRAALHLFRAEWYERLGRVEDAARELLWHENDDRIGLPRGDPQPVEIDAALGVEARWRLGRLLDRAGGSTHERCRAYAAVGRLWATGDVVHRARADTAQRRFAELACGEGA